MNENENGFYYQSIRDAKHAGETLKNEGYQVQVKRVIHQDHGPGWGLYIMGIACEQRMIQEGECMGHV